MTVTKPLFSVCTEVTNRESTIIRTMDSIRQQGYQDFDYHIVDNASGDNSVAVIRDYLDQHPSFAEKVHFSQLNTRAPDIEAWNAPIRHATGEYIVVCEGDDWFSHDHLEIIAGAIEQHPGIGLIVSPNAKVSAQAYARVADAMNGGRVPGHEMLKQLLMFEFCPPPSEVVFARTGNGHPFFYDQDHFVYAGEYSLYDQIFDAGLETTLVSSKTVHRGIKAKPTIKTLFHVKDAYHCLFERWQSRYQPQVQDAARKKLLVTLAKIIAQQIIWLRPDRETFSYFLQECRSTTGIPWLTIINGMINHAKIRLKLMIKRVA